MALAPQDVFQIVIVHSPPEPSALGLYHLIYSFTLNPLIRSLRAFLLRVRPGAPPSRVLASLRVPKLGPTPTQAEAERTSLRAEVQKLLGEGESAASVVNHHIWS